MQLTSGNQMTGQQTQREVGVENYRDGDATTNTYQSKRDHPVRQALAMCGTQFSVSIEFFPWFSLYSC